MRIKIGSQVKVRLHGKFLVYNLTITKLYPQYRYSKLEPYPWWIEGTTKSGKTMLRFHESEIMSN